MKDAQLELDFADRRTFVVLNHWNDQWHLCDYWNFRPAWATGLPNTFNSVEEAVAVARAHGVEPDTTWAWTRGRDWHDQEQFGYQPLPAPGVVGHRWPSPVQSEV